MSVDARLEAAFATTDESWGERRASALAEVTRRHRRGVVTRRTSAGFVAAAVLAGAILAVGRGEDRDAAPQPTRPPSTPAQSEQPAPILGRWRSARISEAEVRRVLDRAGLVDYSDDVLKDLPSRPFRLDWVVAEATAQLRVSAGGHLTVLDEEAPLVQGGRVTLSPRFAAGSSTHRYALDGDTLRLRFESTTEPPTAGVPGEVWQRLLYDSFDFERDRSARTLG